MPISRYVTVFGKKMWIDIIEGEVVSQQKWAETHVSGSGGGGWVNNAPGYTWVKPIDIYSSTTTNHEFWIREPNGKEASFSFSNVNFPVRDGHLIRLAWASAEGFKKGDYVFSSNLTAGKTVEHKNIGQWLKYFKKIRVIDVPKAYRPIKLGMALASAFAIRVGASVWVTTLDVLPGSNNFGLKGDSAAGVIDQLKVFFAALLKDYKPAASLLLSLNAAQQAVVLGFVALGFYMVYSVLGRIFFLPGWRIRRTRVVRDVLWQEFQRPMGNPPAN